MEKYNQNKQNPIAIPYITIEPTKVNS